MLESEDIRKLIAEGRYRAGLSGVDSRLAVRETGEIIDRLTDALEVIEASIERVRDVISKDAYDVRESAFWADRIVSADLIEEAIKGQTERQFEKHIDDIMKLHAGTDWSDAPDEHPVCAYCGSRLNEDFQCLAATQIEQAAELDRRKNA